MLAQACPYVQVEREIQIHAQLDHENVIKLFAAFEDAENVYLAQEFAAGQRLALQLPQTHCTEYAHILGPLKVKYRSRNHLAKSQTLSTVGVSYFTQASRQFGNQSIDWW